MTEILDTATGELLTLDRGAAERRAERISLRLDSIADNYTTVMPMIRDAIAKRDDQALGYRSPGDYVSDRFGATLGRLGMEVRREVVRELTEAGMSTRAIAPVVGVSPMTAHRDLAGGTHVPPDAPREPVIGIDGKTYTLPKPARPASSGGEANTINAVAALLRRAFTPANLATLSPRARRHLIDLLNEAIETLAERDSHDD